MIKYVVTGYNPTDYISNLVDYETLGIFDTQDQAEDYIRNHPHYITHLDVKENPIKEFLIDPDDNVHWEIYINL